MGFAQVEHSISCLLEQRHERKRVSIGKDAKVIDHSMATVGAISKDDDGMEQEGRERDDDNAFKDMGDIENEDFIYVF